MDNTKKLVATYELIRGYKNERTNYWLALSEFIDNSISSYKNKNPNNPIDGLMINIDIDYSDNENKKITITDNANGMGMLELLDAMQPNSREGKTDNDYNQYGIGMKLGIFWFGEDGLVYSKKKNEKTYCIDFETKTKNKSKAIELKAIEIDENIFLNSESGTKIIISNVYPNRKINKKDLERIEDALGWRYSKLIQRGLKISLSSTKGDEKRSSNIAPFYIEEYKNIPFNFNQFINYKKGKSREIPYDRISEVKSEIRKELVILEEISNSSDYIIKKEKLDIYLKNIDETLIDSKDMDKFLDLRIESYEKFLDGKDLFFEREISINKSEPKIQFGILGGDFQNNKESGFSKDRYTGLTTYHIDRAINHGPNEVDQCSNLLFAKSIKGNTTNSRWMYGEINLTGIENPDKNKSKFDWSYDEAKDKRSDLVLQEETTHLYKSLLGIITHIVEITKYQKIEKITTEALKTVKNDVSNHLPSIDFSINRDVEGDDFLNFYFPIFENEYEARIYENNRLGKDLIKIEKDEDEKIIKVHFNNDHAFWKPLLKNEDTEIRGKMIYPIIITMIISNEVSLLNDLIRKDFLTTFNDVVSTFKKDIRA